MRSGERQNLAVLFGAPKLVGGDLIVRRALAHLRRYRHPTPGSTLSYVVAVTAELNDSRLKTLNVKTFSDVQEPVAILVKCVEKQSESNRSDAPKCEYGSPPG